MDVMKDYKQGASKVPYNPGNSKLLFHRCLFFCFLGVWQVINATFWNNMDRIFSWLQTIQVSWVFSAWEWIYYTFKNRKSTNMCEHPAHHVFRKGVRVHQIIANLFRHPVYTRILSPYGNNFFIDEFKLKFTVIHWSGQKTWKLCYFLSSKSAKRTIQRYLSSVKCSRYSVT